MVQINFTILANLISFLVLFFFITKFLSGPILKMLDDRADKIRESFSRAKEEEARIEQMKSEYSDKIQSVLNEAVEIRNNSRKLAEEEREKILNQAKKDSELILLKAEKNAKTQYESAKEQLKKEIFKYAILLSEKIVKKEISEEKHKEYVDVYLKELKIN